MRARSRSCAWLVAPVTLVVWCIMFTTTEARAQATSPCPKGASWCIGPDGRILVTPPPVVVDPRADAQARARAEAEARARTEARTRAEYEAWLKAQQAAAMDLEVTRVLAWQAYLSWRTRVRLDIQATVGAQLSAAADANASAQIPDRYAGLAPPALGAESDIEQRYPAFEMSLFPFCAAVFSGRDLPAYAGFCVPLRYRLTKTWSVVLDPSFVFERYGDVSFKSVGLHPGVEWSFAHGRGSASGADGYLRAGLDGQLPVNAMAVTPDTFVGAHVGVGAHARYGPIGIGVEWRGLVRGGSSEAPDGISRVRLGAEVRLYLLTFTF